MPVPVGGFRSLMDNALGVAPGFDLMHIGPLSTAVLNVAGNESRTRPMIANFFWQAYLGHPLGYERLVSLIKADNPAFVARKVQVVWHGAPHGEARGDLLILGTGLRDPEHTMIVLDVEFTEDETRHGWDLFAAKDQGAIARQHGMLHRFHPRDVAAAAAGHVARRHAPFRVLVVEADESEMTASVPSGALNVANGDTDISTAGVIAANAGGTVGVTAALHAVRDALTGSLSVGGCRARIVSTDSLSDSAFLESDVPSSGPPAQVLSGMTPRIREDVHFDGAVSGRVASQIVGIDPRLPFLSQYAQLVVTTDLVTARGDSGAALIDATGKVLGFAHERTTPNARNPYSSWIWAELVFQAHRLT